MIFNLTPPESTDVDILDDHGVYHFVSRVTTDVNASEIQIPLSTQYQKYRVTGMGLVMSSSNSRSLLYLKTNQAYEKTGYPLGLKLECFSSTLNASSLSASDQYCVAAMMLPVKHDLAAIRTASFVMNIVKKANGRTEFLTTGWFEHQSELCFGCVSIPSHDIQTLKMVFSGHDRLNAGAEIIVEGAM